MSRSDRKDYIGHEFGKLKVIDYAPDRVIPSGRVVYWLCECSCGRTPPHEVRGKSLTSKKKPITMCAACAEDIRLEAVTTHGQTNTSLYHIWQGMKSRTGINYTKPSDAQYYKEKGIRMSHEWAKSFPSFKKWADETGYQDGDSIDRIDNDKGYFKKNCRWTDTTGQNQNLTTNVVLTWNGITACASVIHNKSESPVKYGTFMQRLRNGWTLEDALFTLTPGLRKGKRLID